MKDSLPQKAEGALTYRARRMNRTGIEPVPPPVKPEAENLTLRSKLSAKYSFLVIQDDQGGNLKAASKAVHMRRLAAGE